MYRITYREIREMAKRRAMSLPLARKIVRKSGFRPSLTTETNEGTGGALILSVPPVSPVGGCPKPPFADGVFESHADRMAFYEDALAAEGGDPADLDAIRDEWLIGYFQMTDEIVMDCVMPLLGYFYSGEVCTITLLEENGCAVEVDIAPPSNGFWEQYETSISVSRFEDSYQFFPTSSTSPAQDYQNCKFLTARIRWDTHATYQIEELDVSEATDYQRDSLIAENLQGLQDEPFVGYRVEGYLVNYDEDGILTIDAPLAFPRLKLTNDDQMALRLTEVGGGAQPTLSNADAGQMAGAITMSQFGSPDTTDWGNWGYYGFLVNNPFGLHHRIKTDWRPVTDPPATFDTLQPVYPAFAADPEQTAAGTSPPDDITFDDLVVKKGPAFLNFVEFSEQPTSEVENEVGYAVSRYDESFELFDVVAVRVVGGGPSVPV